MGRDSRRDSQKSKAYAAERQHSQYRVRDLGDDPTNADAQAFVNGVLRRAWVRKQFGTRRVVVKAQSRAAHARGHTISASPWARNRLIMLHELAHCLTQADVGHGRDWARVYLLLVSRVMGSAHGAELRRHFVANGVKYRKVTTAQRAAGRRLAATRGDGGAGLARWRAEQAAAKAAALTPERPATATTPRWVDLQPPEPVGEPTLVAVSTGPYWPE